MQALIELFTDDATVRVVAILVALDFLLGVTAALADGSFRFGWLPDFLRRDILGKVVPYFAVWAAVRLGGDVELGGIGVIEEGVGATVVAAMSASILNSLRDLRVLRGAPDVVAGSDGAPPAP